MPVPTDTFWKISRLNKVFALSSIVLFFTFAGAVVQDWWKDWREPQRSAKVWEAALVDQRLVDRDNLAARAEELDKDIEKKRQEVEGKGSEYETLSKQKAQKDSELAILDFRTNTLKAVVAEQMKYLEEAKTAGDNERVVALNDKLAEPNKTLDGYVEQQGALKADIARLKDQLTQVTASLDALKKERTQLTEERDSLAKKRDSLQPPTFTGKAMTMVRQTPLLQFMNPAEKPHQVVLPDIKTDLGGVKTVDAIDRCVTCHVNIDKKDFAEDNVLAYLEEQTATARKLALDGINTGKPADPQTTQVKPGPAAMPEFWVKTTAIAKPELLKKPSLANRIRTMSPPIGASKDATKPKTTQLNVTVDGKPLDSFTFKPDATGDELDVQTSVVGAVIETWLHYKVGDAKTATVTRGRVSITVDDKTTAANANTQRRLAALLVEDFRNSLLNAADPKQAKTVLDQYRRAMVAEVNVARAEVSLPDLDPSPVILAHPKLELYAEVDSKHPIEKVGCTSCHDGSGLETRFILAAHTARPIWVDKDTGAPVLAQQLKPNKPLEETSFKLDNMLRAIYPADAMTPWPVRMMHLPDLSDQVEARVPTTRPTSIAAPEEPPAELHEAVDYVDPVTGAKGRAVSQRMYWKGKYELESGQSMETTNHHWDWPMRPPQFIQANCVRCHTSVNDIKETAPIVHKGRHLFTNLGCNNCHQMDTVPANEQRKVGTDLRHVSSKLSPAMINTWMWAPKSFRPTTKMPHFFMLENNSSDEEIRRTRQEALAMTEYLVATSDPLPAKHAIPSGMKGTVDEGRKVFNTVGCLACHQNLSDPVGGQRNGKPITRAEQWITQDMEGSGRLAEEMVKRNGKAPTSAEVKTEALRQFDAMTYNERQLYVDRFLGEPAMMSTQPETYPFLQKDGKPVPKPVFMQHGPELSAIGQKLTADRTPDQARPWLFDWLKEPQHHADYTVMPNLRLSDQQAIDLTEYLLAQSRKTTHPDDPWQAGVVETDSEKLIELTSLFLRSRYSPQVATRQADDETELRALATDALTTPKVDKAAAAQRVAAMDKDSMRKLFLGKKLISHYGCMQCHAINGGDGMASPCPSLLDWGQKLVSKLDYNFVDPHKAHGLPAQNIPMVDGVSPQASTLIKNLPADHWKGETGRPVTAAWPHVDHTRDDWLLHKLQNTRLWDRGRQLLEPQREMKDGKTVYTDKGYPRIKDSGRPYDKIKMPTFYLNEDEVNAIATFVLSSRTRFVSDAITAKATNDRAQRIAHGRYLATEKFNCTSCHLIEANRPQIHQYYPDETKIPQFAPPQLRSEGSRIQHAWLFSFLKNVQPLRPTLVDGIRMPSFHATDEEWTSIVAYFNDVANRESQQLKKRIDAILAYKQKKRAELLAKNPKATEEELKAAGADWFAQPSLAADTAYLRDWVLTFEIGKIVPSTIPLTGTVAERSAGYEQMLYAARLTVESFAAPYPFVEPAVDTMAQDRYDRGRQFFLELDCLQCHTMGEPTAGTAPTAPNLHQVEHRIRRGWANHWVKDPGYIHKNSPMLQFFSGEKVGDPKGQTWKRAQGGTLEEIARTEAAYGKTSQEQIDLLLDFVYAASARRENVKRLPTGSKAPSQDMAEKGEIKFTVPAPATKPAEPAPTTKPATADTPAPSPTTPTPAPAPPPPPAAKGPTGTVAGVVTFNGTAPKPAEVNMAAVKECHDQHTDSPVDESIVVSAKGELKNVIVSLKKEEGSDLGGEIPKQPAVIDQKGCVYSPHVLPVMVGQQIVVKNSDNFGHNVHSFSTANPPFNFAQNKDPGKAIAPLKAAEQFAVKCDVHPWMQMWVVCFDHPYFAATGDDGTFTLPPLPEGTHTLRFWHEKFGVIEKEVKVEAGKKVEVKVAFEQK